MKEFTIRFTIDDGAEWMRMECERLGVEVNYGNVSRFIDLASRDKSGELDREAISAASSLLGGLIIAAKNGDNLNSFVHRAIGVKKLRSKMFDPETAPTSSPAFSVVSALLLKQISKKEAIEAFAEHVQPASDRQIENWIKVLKPRVEQWLQFLAFLQSEAKNEKS